MKRNYWTEEDLNTLRRLYPDVSIPICDIAKLLGRTENVIYNKAKYALLQTRRGFIPHNKIKWPEKDLQFIKDNYITLNNAQLAKGLNKKLTVVRDKMRELGIKRMEMEYWTSEQVSFLKANYGTMGNVDMAAYFQQHWPKKKRWTWKHIEKKMKYLNLKRTTEEQFLLRTGRYNPEHYKDFDGKKFPEGKKRIWMQNGKQYWMIKRGNEFVKFHIYKWQKLRGKIPKGMKLGFKDGDTMNCKISNLVLETPSELAKRVSLKNHDEMNDNYIAGILARHGRDKADPDLKKRLLNNPEILSLKRLQLNLNRKLKQK